MMVSKEHKLLNYSYVPVQYLYLILITRRFINTNSYVADLVKLILLFVLVKDVNLISV